MGSAAIASSNKKQPTVALSSTEVEYRGVALATCEVVWPKRLLKDLQVEVFDPMRIYSDNLSSIQLAKNPVFHARTKHIEMHYHFVREHVLSGEVELVYVATDRQTANILTKPLGLDKLQQFSGALGLRHLDVPNLRGREEQESSAIDREAESGEEFDFRWVEEAESGHGANNRREEPNSVEQGEDGAKKGEKYKTKTWSDVVKGLKTKDKLESTNSE